MNTGKGKGKTGKSNFYVKRKLKQKQKDVLLGITKSAIKRVARRAGVKRLSDTVYEEFRTGSENMKPFIEKVVKDALVFTEYNKRKTITVGDVLNSLKRQNRIMYGYDEPTSSMSKIKPKKKAPKEKIETVLVNDPELQSGLAGNIIVRSLRSDPSVKVINKYIDSNNVKHIVIQTHNKKKDKKVNYDISDLNFYGNFKHNFNKLYN